LASSLYLAVNEDFYNDELEIMNDELGMMNDELGMMN
jgi:hypothetical protein